MTAADNCDDLELLATGFARARTEGVFSVLAQMLAAALDASEVMICEVSGRTRARTLAVWRDGASAPNYEYELTGTPCARARAGETLTLELSARAVPRILRHASHGERRRGARPRLRVHEGIAAVRCAAATTLRNPGGAGRGRTAPRARQARTHVAAHADPAAARGSGGGIRRRCDRGRERRASARDRRSAPRGGD